MTHKNCLSDAKPIEQAIIGWQYDDIATHLIAAFKYANAFFLAQTLSELLINNASLTKEIVPGTHIMPLPLHVQRVKDRGFSPVELISRELAEKLHLKYINDLVIRTKNNPHQAFVKKELRTKFVENIFAVNHVRYKVGAPNISSLLIFDDVMTTGATLNSLTTTIHNAFPQIHLRALCLFRGKPHFKD